MAAVCRQYLYDWQFGCSGFGKRPDATHVKTLGVAVVVDSEVVGCSVDGIVVVVEGSGGFGTVVVIIGTEVVTVSVEDSSVDVVIPIGHVYIEVATHLFCCELKIVLPGQKKRVDTTLPSEFFTQL